MHFSIAVFPLHSVHLTRIINIYCTMMMTGARGGLFISECLFVWVNIMELPSSWCWVHYGNRYIIIMYIPCCVCAVSFCAIFSCDSHIYVISSREARAFHSADSSLFSRMTFRLMDGWVNLVVYFNELLALWQFVNFSFDDCHVLLHFWSHYWGLWFWRDFWCWESEWKFKYLCVSVHARYIVLIFWVTKIGVIIFNVVMLNFWDTCLNQALAMSKSSVFFSLNIFLLLKKFIKFFPESISVNWVFTTLCTSTVMNLSLHPQTHTFPHAIFPSLCMWL